MKLYQLNVFSLPGAYRPEVYNLNMH